MNLAVIAHASTVVALFGKPVKIVNDTDVDLSLDLDIEHWELKLEQIHHAPAAVR